MSQASTTRTAAAGVVVRPAEPADLAFISAIVQDLADYEKLAHAAVAGVGEFERALFAAQPRVFCDIAEWNGEPGGIAIWFYNFSTFRGQHGIYLEDLYVRPTLRSHGLGKALLKHLAKRCVEEDLPRVEWAVLDWNSPAIAFYRAQGAVLLDDWTTCRLSGEALAQLAAA